MKKYTDTELLEILLPMLNYSIITRADASNILDTVDFNILESDNFVSKSFVVALQNRINKLAEKISVEATNIIGDQEDARCTDDSSDDECRWDKCIPIYSAREYDKLKRELLEREHEMWRLKGKVEALEYLIYNCTPKDNKRKD